MEVRFRSKGTQRRHVDCYIFVCGIVYNESFMLLVVVSSTTSSSCLHFNSKYLLLSYDHYGYVQWESDLSLLQLLTMITTVEYNLR